MTRQILAVGEPKKNGLKLNKTTHLRNHLWTGQHCTGLSTNSG
jgi:hypothetical protein